MKILQNTVIIVITLIVLLAAIYANDIAGQIKTVNDTSLLATYNKLAEKYYNVNIDSCTKYNKLALQLVANTDDKTQKVLAYNMKGMILGQKGFLKECLDYHYKALKEAECIKDTFLIARLLNNIGGSYFTLRDNENAEKYLREALLLKNNKSVKVAPVYNNLGLIYQRRSLLDSALVFFNKALESFTQDKDSTGIASSYSNIGIVLFAKGEHQSGMEKLKQTLNLCRRLGDSSRVATILVNIGNNYMIMQKYKLAKYYLNQCNNIVKKSQNSEIKNNLYLVYSMLYRELGNTNKALKYYKMYHQLSDSIFDMEKQKQVTDLNIRYETIKKNKTIELLHKDKQISEERMKMKTKLIIVLSVTGIIILIFCIIIILIKRDQLLSQIILVKKNIEIAKKQEFIDNNPDSDINNDSIYTELKYSHSKLSDEQKDKLYNLVLNALTKDKVYLQKDLTIDRLSEYLNVSRTYLSQIINEKFRKSFIILINEYRIIEARKQLLNNKHLTIEAIANNVGFKSKSSFNAAFKKYTGVTPSFFMKNSESVSYK